MADAIVNKHKGIVGNSFNTFFREIKYLYSNGGMKTDGVTDPTLDEFLKEVDKREIIIFSTDEKRIETMENITKKIIFPFEKIYLELSMFHDISIKEEQETFVSYTPGFFMNAIRDENKRVTALLIVSMWFDYGKNPNDKWEEGLTPKVILLPLSVLNSTNSRYEDFPAMPSWDKDICIKVITTLKKICYLIQRKEYNQYYKWTSGGVQSKEIIYSHDVKSHRRHFWKDSGKFKIATLEKEEAIARGYEIDELVFRGNELRRDVVCKVIEQYTVGKAKEKKESNRIIELLRRRILRQEEKIYSILREIYPELVIRRHDRKTLNGIELDFNIPELRLGIEYDGEQHFDKELYEKLYGDGFEEQVKRDRLKDTLCRRKDIKLVRIKFDEPITLTHIRKRINNYA